NGFVGDSGIGCQSCHAEEVQIGGDVKAPGPESLTERVRALAQQGCAELAAAGFVGCTYKPTKAVIPKDPNEKAGPAGRVLSGQVMTYSVSYENIGDGTAFAVYVEDVLGENFDETTLAIQGGGYYAPLDRTITWDVGTLKPKGQAGSSGTVTYTVALKAGL